MYKYSWHGCEELDDVKNPTMRRAQCHEEPDNTVTLTTTQRAQQWCKEPEDDAKSSMTWRTQWPEEPNDAKNPNDMKNPKMQRARCHGEPEFGAGPCPAPFFFFNLFLVPLHQEGLPPPWNFYFLVTSVWSFRYNLKYCWSDGHLIVYKIIISKIR